MFSASTTISQVYDTTTGTFNIKLLKKLNAVTEEDIFSVNNDFVYLPDGGDREWVDVKAGNLYIRYCPGGKESFNLEIDFIDRNQRVRRNMLRFDNYRLTGFKFESLMPFDLGSFYERTVYFVKPGSEEEEKIRAVVNCQAKIIKEFIIKMMLSEPIHSEEFRNAIHFLPEDKPGAMLQKTLEVYKKVRHQDEITYKKSIQSVQQSNPSFMQTKVGMFASPMPQVTRDASLGEGLRSRDIETLLMLNKEDITELGDKLHPDEGVSRDQYKISMENIQVCLNNLKQNYLLDWKNAAEQRNLCNLLGVRIKSTVLSPILEIFEQENIITTHVSQLFNTLFNADPKAQAMPGLVGSKIKS